MANRRAAGSSHRHLRPCPFYLHIHLGLGLFGQEHHFLRSSASLSMSLSNSSGYPLTRPSSSAARSARASLAARSLFEAVAFAPEYWNGGTPEQLRQGRLGRGNQAPPVFNLLSLCSSRARNPLASSALLKIASFSTKSLVLLIGPRRDILRPLHLHQASLGLADAVLDFLGLDEKCPQHSVTETGKLRLAPGNHLFQALLFFRKVRGLDEPSAELFRPLFGRLEFLFEPGYLLLDDVQLGLLAPRSLDLALSSARTDKARTSDTSWVPPCRISSSPVSRPRAPAPGAPQLAIHTVLRNSFAVRPRCLRAKSYSFLESCEKMGHVLACHVIVDADQIGVEGTLDPVRATALS